MSKRQTSKKNFAFVFAFAWSEHRLSGSDDTHVTFVSFSHHERPFVKSELVEYLERSEFGFKLCVHERDFMVGDTIPANIEAAINHSRRVVMVISR